MIEIILKGERMPPKGYEPSETLKEAILTFRQAVINTGRAIDVSIGQTDRDIEIDIKCPPSNGSPFGQVIRYYVWEEGGQPVGCKADSGGFV